MSQPSQIAGQAEASAELLEPANFWQELLTGVATQSWLASMAFHMALMIVLALVLGTMHVASTIGQAPEFDAVTARRVGVAGDHALRSRPYAAGTERAFDRDADAHRGPVGRGPVQRQLADSSKKQGGGTKAGKSTFGGLGSFNIASTDLGPSLKGRGRRRRRRGLRQRAWAAAARARASAVAAWATGRRCSAPAARSNRSGRWPRR